MGDAEAGASISNGPAVSIFLKAGCPTMVAMSPCKDK